MFMVPVIKFSAFLSRSQCPANIEWSYFNYSGISATGGKNFL